MARLPVTINGATGAVDPAAPPVPPTARARAPAAATNPGYWGKATNPDGTLAGAAGATNIGVRPPPVDTSVVGTAPPWLRTQGVDYNDASNVTLTNPSYDDLAPISTDFSGDAAKGADAAYKGATQFFDKDFAKSRADLETQLQNSGFAVGSEAYNNELDRMERGQNAARENAAYAAQGVGFSQSGDLLQRALAARAASVGERDNQADRLYNQSMGVAGLKLGRSGQITSAQAAAGSNAASRYSTDANTALALRRLGLDQDTMDFGQLMALTQSARGGVNMPNFGAPQPLDVGGANQIASANSNSAAARAGADRAGLYGLGAAALGGFGNYLTNGY